MTYSLDQLTAGFWIVTKYMCLSVKQGLTYWTTLPTIFDVVRFLITWAIYAVARPAR